MGYELHITLADNWTRSESKPITEAVWQAVHAEDPSLGMREDVYLHGTVRIRPVVWNAHPAKPAFWSRRGRVDVKNPDARTDAKMKEIAAALGARVVGDDDEEY